MKNAKRIFSVWIVVMLVATFACALVYVVSQQMLRLGENMPLAALANDTSLKLSGGQAPDSLLPADKIDIAESSGTFVIIYDSDKKLVASSGIYKDALPSIPAGVLDYASKKGEDRVTWQPEAGLRFATVTVKSGSGYVVAAAPLKETESLIGKIGNLIAAAWAAFAVLSLALLAALDFISRKIFKAEE
jgi:hypothetical protein